MTLNKSTFDAVRVFLTPYMTTVEERKSLIESALFGCEVLTHIEWSGSELTFTPNLISKLDRYGEYPAGQPALVSVLKTIKVQSGRDKHRQIDWLITRILQPWYYRYARLILMLIFVVLILGFVLALRSISPCSLSNTCLSPFPLDAFVIGVAEFGFEDGQRVTLTSESKEVSKVLFTSIQGITSKEYTIAPYIIGFVEDTEQDDQLKASQLAAQYNIDILIYGTIKQDNYYNTIEYKIAFSSMWTDQEPGLFIDPEKIEVLRSEPFTISYKLKQQITALKTFVEALNYYISGDYFAAYRQFNTIASIDEATIQTAASIYAANSAGRSGNYKLALEALEPLLYQASPSSRALYARGNALLNMAADFENNLQYDPNLDLDLETCLSEQLLDRRRLALMAILCFEEAKTYATDDASYVSLRAQISLGQANLFLANLPGGEYERLELAWEYFDDTRQQFIELGSPSKLSYFGGLAYKGLGDVESIIQQSDICRIYSHYGEALNLINMSADHASSYIQEHLIKPLEKKVEELKSC